MEAVTTSRNGFKTGGTGHYALEFSARKLIIKTYESLSFKNLIATDGRALSLV